MNTDFHNFEPFLANLALKFKKGLIEPQTVSFQNFLSIKKLQLSADIENVEKNVKNCSFKSY
jgi:hypothetical protein